MSRYMDSVQGYLNFTRSSESDPEAARPQWFFSEGILTKSRKKPPQGAIQIHPPKPEPATAPVSYVSYYAKVWNILEKHFANPLSSLVASKTMLLPHQVQAAIHVVESLNPRVLIADEVGLGKTVEAGLILKELILKQNCKSVLVAVPAPLVFQWQSEMKHKFNEDFVIVNGPALKKNPRLVQEENRIIVSIDLLRDKEKWPAFLDKKFDIVIFDEAHRLRKDQTKTTKAYQFAENISKNTRALILLSATPFRGKLEEIYYLIQLIDPDILGPMHTFLSSYTEDSTGALKNKISSVVIRRRKVDIGGFTKRFAKTLKLTLPPVERAFYDEVTEYVKKEYNRAVDAHQHVRAFVAVVFQKLLDSSSHALLSALKKRKIRLEQMYYRLPKSPSNLSPLFELEDEELDWEEESDLMIESVFDPAEVRQEIMSLNRLITLGEKIDYDYKLKTLKDTLKKLFSSGHKKIIIFTQFKRTLEYIDDYLKDDFQISVFHGGLSAKDKEDAIEEFYKKTEILICTEAGGEGRNLQIASVLINYDLPWSPLKVEQRIGRIHRFGQANDVYIMNFAMKDTIAEKVLEILERKIKIFEDAFGSSDILLGMTEDDTSIEKSLTSLLSNKKSQKESEEELKTSLRAAKDNLHKIENLVSTEVLNFNMNAFQKALETKESGAQNEELMEEIIMNAGISGLNAERSESGEILYSLDGEIRQGTFNLEESSRNGYLDYLTLGHPFVDKALQKLITSVEPGVYYEAEDHKVKIRGMAVYFEVRINLDRVYRRRYSVFIHSDANLPSPIPDYELKEVQPVSVTLETIQTPLETALRGIYPAIQQDIEKLISKTKYGIHFRIENIKNSYKHSEEELSEKLQLQQGKAHWYGEDRMSGAIQRTLNKKITEKKRAENKIYQLENKLNLQTNLHIKHILFLNTKPVDFNNGKK